MRLRKRYYIPNLSCVNGCAIVIYIALYMNTSLSCPEIIVIAHNIRSAHNVGSVLRTCEGFGVSRVILSGYTPYPTLENDPRLPHVAAKLTKDIHKTALGAEHLVSYEHQAEPDFQALRNRGFVIVGLEQDLRSVPLPEYSPPQKAALLLGEEVNGIADELRDECDTMLEIPMKGKKESFNVSVAAGIALYALTSGNT